MLSTMLVLVVGQVVSEPEGQPNASVQQVRYESFLRAAKRYAMRLEKDDEALKLVDKPVLRWGNQARDNDDGAVFVWTRRGRPQAVAAIFLIGERTMHELCSLAEAPLKTTWGENSPAWRPARAGVVFRKVPGAPAPAETGRARLTQMRTMAGDFTAATSAPPDYGGGRSHGELRLLPQPLFRNEGESPVALDGALFTFAFGTDPEVLLMLEARKTPAGPLWHYAAAPFTDFEIQLKYKGDPVWSEPLAQESRSPMRERTHAGIWEDELRGVQP
jgi:hypothetical protein